ncbi:MAG: UDP-N-acetylmuramate dehydrogenase [Gammaproteobacteria bacterium]
MNALPETVLSALPTAFIMEGLRGKLRHEEPLARHTSWRVGGPAQHFYQPADIDDVATLLRQLPPTEAVFWLGLGSNLLVRDGGLRGTVIATSGMLNGLTQLGAQSVRAEAGVPCAKVARFTAQAGLHGGEFFAGIPGTMGGALAMNAGAFGAETWSLVQSVETVDRCGERHVRSVDEYRIAYRNVTIPQAAQNSYGHPQQEWFVAATLRFTQADSGSAKARIKQLLERRNLTQPISQPSAGSVFRNPPGDHAARLIETCGLKGVCIGKACVSEKHANFIINTGAARAADIEALIATIIDAVEQRHGVRLIPEVRIVGEPA